MQNVDFVKLILAHAVCGTACMTAWQVGAARDTPMGDQGAAATTT